MQDNQGRLEQQIKNIPKANEIDKINSNYLSHIPAYNSNFPDRSF